MFKVVNEADIPQFVEKYQTLKQDQKKVNHVESTARSAIAWLTDLFEILQDGKPYILSVDAYKPVNDPRTQGYNLVANTTFSSLDDVKYYDEKCEAHGALKAFAKEKVAGPPMVVMWETS